MPPMKEEMQGFHMTPIAEIFLGKKALLNHKSPSNYAAPGISDLVSGCNTKVLAKIRI